MTTRPHPPLRGSCHQDMCLHFTQAILRRREPTVFKVRRSCVMIRMMTKTPSRQMPDIYANDSCFGRTCVFCSPRSSGLSPNLLLTSSRRSDIHPARNSIDGPKVDDYELKIDDHDVAGRTMRRSNLRVAASSGERGRRCVVTPWKSLDRLTRRLAREGQAGFLSGSILQA
jgi:hypothetical protein